MTVNTTTRRDDYIGNDATAIYSYNFRIFDETELLVTKQDTSGIETTLSYPADYSVSGVGEYAGGSITLTAGNLPAGYMLTIRRKLALLQETDLRNQGGYFADVQEDALDRLIMIALQHQDEIDRSVKLPETESGSMTLPTSTQRASRFLAFDAAGDPIAATAVTEVAVTPFMETLLDDTTAAAALTTLGVSAFVQTLIDDTDADSFTQTLIAGLTAETAPATDDVVLLGDTSEAKGNKMTLANMLKVINALTEDITPDSVADYLLSYDASASAVKKVLTKNALVLRGHISGLVPTNNGTDANNDIDIGVGECSDSSGVVIMRVAAALTKQLDAAWAAGTNAGGLFSGAKAVSTWYHLFIIRKDSDGTIDAGFDTSLTAANRPAGYTYYRQIYSVHTDGSGNIEAFNTYEVEGGGLETLWETPTLDVDLSNTLTTSRRSDTIRVPTGYSVEAMINYRSYDASASARIYISCPDVADQAPSDSVAPIYTGVSTSSLAAAVPLRVRTNTSGQISSRADLATVDTFRVSTLGWKWGRR